MSSSASRHDEELALKAVCREHWVPSSSYIYEDTIAVEHFAKIISLPSSTPTRILQAKQNDDGLEGEDDEAKEMWIGCGEREAGILDHIFVVPGGRFLLGQSHWETGMIDLEGDIADTAPECFSLWDTRDRRGTSFLAHLYGEDEIRIIISEKTGDKRFNRLGLLTAVARPWDMDLSPPQPCPAADMGYVDPNASYALSEEDLVVVLIKDGQRRCYMWNLDTNIVRTWNVDSPKYFGESKIIIDNTRNVIFLIDLGFIQAWKIPIFESEDSEVVGAANAHIDNPAVLHMTFAIPSAETAAGTSETTLSHSIARTRIVSVDDWYNGPNIPLTFDILTYSSKYDADIMNTYWIQLQPGVELEAEVVLVDRQILQGSASSPEEILHFEPHRVMGGYIFKTWCFEDMVYLQMREYQLRNAEPLTAFDINKEPNLVQAIKLLKVPETDEEKDFSEGLKAFFPDDGSRCFPSDISKFSFDPFSCHLTFVKGDGIWTKSFGFGHPPLM
ncbi:hypothetical protein BJ165DRAFT_1476565 [Panaeolus papilionaceus]|nr:hypothetical protein BJ165DRAFT_1476565 [Panaeolus papilionaceus]